MIVNNCLFGFQSEGNDRLSFLCEVDLKTQVPSSWMAALDLLRENSLRAGSLGEREPARIDPYDIYVHASNIWTQSSDWLITDSNEVIDKLP